MNLQILDLVLCNSFHAYHSSGEYFPFCRLFLTPLPSTVMGLHGNEIISLVWDCGVSAIKRMLHHRRCVATAAWMENSRVLFVAMFSIFIRARKCVLN